MIERESKSPRPIASSDANGLALFASVYPGWYQGRTVHIHFKIRTASNHEFTSQLFFDDNLTDTVFAKAPYAQKGVRTLRNEGDSIFQQSAGQLTLDLAQSGAGYGGVFSIGLQF